MAPVARHVDQERRPDIDAANLRWWFRSIFDWNGDPCARLAPSFQTNWQPFGQRRFSVFNIHIFDHNHLFRFRFNCNFTASVRNVTGRWEAVAVHVGDHG